jgi:hypothetical protein
MQPLPLDVRHTVESCFRRDGHDSVLVQCTEAVLPFIQITVGARSIFYQWVMECKWDYFQTKALKHEYYWYQHHLTSITVASLKAHVATAQ